MKLTFFKIFAFLLVTVSIYSYVGQLVPQFEEHPPAKKVITPATPPADLAAIGEEMLRTKGGCLICHKVTETGNERGPDLRQAAGKAAARRDGMEAEAYLLESLVEPEAFLVPGYPKMMPSAVKPPANMSMAEVKSVVAYLQTLGGAEVTVKVTDEDVKSAKARVPMHKGKEAMGTYGCLGCHKVEGEGGEVGPELTKVSHGRTPEELLRKIVEPAAWTTPGFQPGIMPVLPVPDGDRAEIVAYLMQLGGKSWSPTGAESPWSDEGVRLGLVVLAFNLAMLAALAVAGRKRKVPEEA
jgi:mono/diheme cytochrome c family protein